MSEVEIKKLNIERQLQGLCAHCATGRNHNCPIQGITDQVKQIRGVPLIVNDEFKGMLWT